MVCIKDASPDTHRARIVYVGIFDFNKLVKTIATWFAEMGYEFHEDVYKTKVPSPDGSEPEFTFSGWIKINEYVQYWIRLKGHIWELKEIEVMVDGEKKKMARGKVQLILWSEIWLDYNGKFTSPVAVKIQNFLHKHVWYKQITGGWEDECYYRMYKLHLEIKKCLNMLTTSNASQIRY